jgi:uncharacterized protein YbjT (DUF2867 family)
VAFPLDRSIPRCVDGATGFIGAALLSHPDRFRMARARPPTAAGRARAGIVPGVEWLPGDLGDPNALGALVGREPMPSFTARAPCEARDSGFRPRQRRKGPAGSRRQPQDAQAPRFLLLSSLAARMPELSYYAGSKWRGECAVKAARQTLRWTVLRPPAVFGPGDRELRLLFRCIAAFARSRWHQTLLLHVDDLALAVLRWLAADTGYGEHLSSMTDALRIRWDTVVWRRGSRAACKQTGTSRAGSRSVARPAIGQSGAARLGYARC